MLAEKSMAFRLDQARTQIGLLEVASLLPQHSTLVAYVRYSKRSLQKSGPGGIAVEAVPSYGAFILQAGQDEPAFVSLGAASEIEQLIATWRNSIAREAEVIDESAKASEKACRISGAALRRKIWDPLVTRLGNARQVFVVSDAALHLVNLAALPLGSVQHVLESGPLINYLSTERDLVPAPSTHGEGLLGVANPAFDEFSKVTDSQPVATVTSASRTRGTRSVCGTFQTLHFSPLPASQGGGQHR